MVPSKQRVPLRSLPMPQKNLLFPIVLASLALLHQPAIYAAQSTQQDTQHAPPDMSHMMHNMNHGGFMQGGMHHDLAKGVKLEQKIDGHTITVRVGPISLPAH